MKEDEKCTEVNCVAGGNEDERIRCDRKVHKNGKCVYHILADRRTTS